MDMYFVIFRRIVAVVVIVVFSLGCQAEGGKLDPQSAEGFVKIQRKIHCNIEDGVEETFVWHGKAYSRVPGERDRHLFNLLGMNVRQCSTVTDQQRGTGYRLVSREIMLYLDPTNNEILRTWDNPWSGDTTEVIHVANDPVNSRPTFGKTKQGKVIPFTARVLGNTWQQNIEVPLFYTNPLAGDYQKYVGGTYHATEIFDFYGDYDELLDAGKKTSYSRVAWVRISGWLPWMEMNSRAGLMYFNAQGGKLQSWDELPQLMKDEIAANYPEYRNAPPLDDTRRNETSWTYFKKVLDKRMKKEKATKVNSSNH